MDTTLIFLGTIKQLLYCILAICLFLHNLNLTHLSRFSTVYYVQRITFYYDLAHTSNGECRIPTSCNPQSVSGLAEVHPLVCVPPRVRGPQEEQSPSGQEHPARAPSTPVGQRQPILVPADNGWWVAFGPALQRGGLVADDHGVFGLLHHAGC